MQIISYKDLTVWQRAIELVIEVYNVTKKLPREEQYGLCAQMRRAAVSIPSNIAEGYKRNNLGEYIQFLGISDASAAELETQIIIVEKIYPQIDTEKIKVVLTETQKMLTVMIRKLDAKR